MDTVINIINTLFNAAGKMISWIINIFIIIPWGTVFKGIFVIIFLSLVIRILKPMIKGIFKGFIFIGKEIKYKKQFWGKKSYYQKKNPKVGCTQNSIVPDIKAIIRRTVKILRKNMSSKQIQALYPFLNKKMIQNVRALEVRQAYLLSHIYGLNQKIFYNKPLHSEIKYRTNMKEKSKFEQSEQKLKELCTMYKEEEAKIETRLGRIRNDLVTMEESVNAQQQLHRRITGDSGLVKSLNDASTDMVNYLNDLYNADYSLLEEG